MQESALGFALIIHPKAALDKGFVGIAISVNVQKISVCGDSEAGRRSFV